MKISLNWLKEYIEIEAPAQELEHKLTMCGLEVEAVSSFESIEGGLEGLVVGEVLTCSKHPDADKLSVTTVDIGIGEPQQIVCGAPNVAAGQKVIVATVGSTLYPTEGEPFKIKKSKIRGEVSMGMICAEDEIGLGTSHAGIMVLDTDLPNGTPASEALNVYSDTIFEIGLTPNRADAASHFGVARDIKALFNKPTRFPEVTLPAVDKERKIEVIVENPDACPRYAGLTISGISVSESPDWLKNKLKAIGLSPINNVVDATNYVLHGLGQPLHAFDADKIGGNTIRVKTLPEGTVFLSLDEVERKLKATDLMICDGNDTPMCIGGVFGGLNSGVSDSTTTIFLESAYFSPDSIRRSSQAHGLKTDAAFRFERGTDPNLPVKALKYAAQLICDLSGGKVASEITDIYAEPIPDNEILVKFSHINRLIGKSLSKEEIFSILSSLDIQVKEETDTSFIAVSSPYRVDVTREADIIEEILRIHGYEQIEVKKGLNSDFLANHPSPNPDAIRSSITQMLAGAGMNEIMTNSLTTSAYSEKLKGVESAESVVILNTLSADLDVMRQSLITSGLEAIAHNLNRKQENLKFFEFGKAYKKVEGKYVEKEVLSLWITGNTADETWQIKNTPSDFYTLASLSDKVMQKVNLSSYEPTSSTHKDFAYGIDWGINGKVIGQLGLLHPKLCKTLDIKQSVFYAEFEWKALVKGFKNARLYSEIPKFPEVRRDLSLVMDKKVQFEEVKQLALKAERKLLQRINVFDVYEGQNLGEGKKSYSVSLFLSDEKKTLTNKEIDKAMNRIMEALEKELNILIRK